MKFPKLKPGRKHYSLYHPKNQGESIDGKYAESRTFYSTMASVSGTLITILIAIYTGYGIYTQNKVDELVEPISSNLDKISNLHMDLNYMIPHSFHGMKYRYDRYADRKESWTTDPKGIFNSRVDSIMIIHDELRDRSTSSLFAIENYRQLEWLLWEISNSIYDEFPATYSSGKYYFKDFFGGLEHSLWLWRNWIGRYESYKEEINVLYNKLYNPIMALENQYRRISGLPENFYGENDEEEISYPYQFYKIFKELSNTQEMLNASMKSYEYYNRFSLSFLNLFGIAVLCGIVLGLFIPLLYLSGSFRSFFGKRTIKVLILVGEFSFLVLAIIFWAIQISDFDTV